MAVINFIEKNERGAWLIHGELGYRQYYGCTKAEAEQRYRNEAKLTIFKNQTNSK